MKIPVSEILSRAVTYPISALVTGATSWLIIDQAGISVLANFSSVAGFIAILAFLDFGGGARVVGLSGSFKITRDIDKLKSGISEAISFQLMMSILILVPATLLFWFQSLILIPYVATVFLVHLASIPFSIVAKVLVGLGQSSKWYWLQLLSSGVALVFCWYFSVTQNIGGIVLLPLIISLLPNLLSTYLSLRQLSISTLGLASSLFAGFEMNTFRKSFGLQKNFALISLFSVVAFASDRALITLVGSSKDLATFTLVSQVFNPGFAMLAAAGLAVWGQFASSSDLGIYSYRLRNSVVFSALGFCLSIVLSICLPIYFHFVAPGALSVDWALAIFFCLFLVMQAFQYPMGYFMLHNDGDKSQMLFLLVACLMKIPLAILFSSMLGVSGIILSSFLIVLIAQVLPGLITLKAHGRLTW